MGRTRPGASRRQVETLKRDMRQLAVAVQPPLYYDVTSNTIYFLEEDSGDFRLTGSLGGGAYSSQEIVALPGGGWGDSVRTPTLHEMNNNASVGTIRVRARRERNGLWYFLAKTC